MLYTTLGNTGLVVSRLSLGTMTFTHGHRSIASIHKVEGTLADALVGRALDAGVNFFDTADFYAAGESETLLGRALGKRRKDVIITTKAGVRTGDALTQAGLSRRHVRRSVDESLARLGTDWIDVYVAHVDDPHTPLDETLSALDDVVRAGKVRYLGFSNWPAWKASAAVEMQRARGLAPFTHGQMCYSLLSRDVEREIAPMMRHHGLGMTVWSPLAGGFLCGKYTRETLSDPSRRYGDFDIFPFDKEHGFAVVERLRAVASAHDATVAQVAIAWLLAKPVVSSVILGATALAQLDDTLRAASITLAPAELAALDEATKLAPAYPGWFSDMVRDAPLARVLGR
ncbi:Oxidoreductase [Minicystis rosea]|nr:Oxidoreductase [Minicystis rosea]